MLMHPVSDVVLKPEEYDFEVLYKIDAFTSLFRCIFFQQFHIDLVFRDIKMRLLMRDSLCMKGCFLRF